MTTKELKAKAEQEVLEEIDAIASYGLRSFNGEYLRKKIKS